MDSAVEFNLLADEWPFWFRQAGWSSVRLYLCIFIIYHSYLL